MAKVGRPSLYDPKFHPKLAFWLAQAGLIDEQMAEELGVHVDTLYEWRKVHPEFSEALKSGKTTPDDEVEAALLRRAKGFKYVEGSKQRVALPDTTACIFWLKNRRPREWRDRREIDQISPEETRSDLRDYSTEELRERLEVLKELRTTTKEARASETN